MVALDAGPAFGGWGSWRRADLVPVPARDVGMEVTRPIPRAVATGLARKGTGSRPW